MKTKWLLSSLIVCCIESGRERERERERKREKGGEVGRR